MTTLHMRQIAFLAICILVVGSCAITLPMKGAYVTGICAFAFLPSCLIAIGWLSDDDLFNPLAGIWLSLFFGMGLRTVYVAISPSERVEELMGRLRLEDLPTGLGIAAIGALGIIVGYFGAARVRFGAPFKGYVASLNENRLMLISVFVGAIALIAAVDFFRRTGFDLSSGLSAKRRAVNDTNIGQSFSALGYHRWIASMVPCVFFYFWYWQFLRSKSLTATIMMLGFGVFAAGFAFLASSRSTICVMLINTLFIANACGRLRFGHTIMTAAAVAAVISVGLMFRQQHSYQKDLSETASITGAVDAVLGNGNLADPGRLTNLYRGVPKLLKYKYGLSYLSWLAAPIPRTQWNAKPAISQGLEITEMIYGGELTAKGIAGGGHPPGFLGEVIMNFGLVGIPFCSIIYGFGLRLFQNFHAEQSHSNSLLSVFIFMPFSFGLMGGEFSRTVVNVLEGIIPAILLLWLTAQRIRTITVDD